MNYAVRNKLFGGWSSLSFSCAELGEEIFPPCSKRIDRDPQIFTVISTLFSPLSLGELQILDVIVSRWLRYYGSYCFVNCTLAAPTIL